MLSLLFYAVRARMSKEKIGFYPARSYADSGYTFLTRLRLDDSLGGTHD
jgi:hypothetical protein